MPKIGRGGHSTWGGVILKAKNGKTHEVKDILRISVREAAEVLDRIDRDAVRYSGQERRKASRQSCRGMSRSPVLLEGEPIGNRTYALYPRNISSLGMSLLHGKFVYDGTACVVGLQTLDGQVVPVRAHVVHCRLITGRIHELGVRFDEPIELADFLTQEGFRIRESGLC